MANEWDRLSVDDVIVELRNRGVTAQVAMEVGARMLIEDDPAAALGLAQAAGVSVQPFEPVQQSNPWGGTVDVNPGQDTAASATVTSAGLTPQQHAEQGSAPPEATGATPPAEQLAQPQQPGQPDTAAAPAPAPQAPEQGQA